MSKCRSCSRPLPESASACAACGAPAAQDSFIATQLLDDAPDKKGDARRGAARDGARPHSSHESVDGARFVAGTVLAERYRIVSLLGRGGMGEVYRADDLKLNQPVALKFLPGELSQDERALARLYAEVRVARQVSHPNVCRVYDVGETEGLHFLSMEFVRGEELASTLKRFGRLPADKAAEIARQICAGLAAAHRTGVLHRDLKPANILIDEAGDARVADFGLAAVAAEVRGREAQSGTPAYMSPEQLAGGELAASSDIYSLGLVLYELFTGRRAYEAPTLGELIRLRRSDATPPSPTSLVKDLDPLVERVIERCLERDPEKRPASALQVAAALPGGDPLAAALAAGETPSPEMVAAAPKEGSLRPAAALALLASFAALLALCCWLTKYTAVYRMTPLDEPPEALRARAREVIREFGYTEQPRDSAEGFVLKDEYLRYVAARDRTPARWERLRTEGPGAYHFWYRQSPRAFETLDIISVDKPALDVSGMTSVYLDTRGRLHWFVGVPPQREPPAPAAAAPDWSLAFRAAGLDVSNFRSVPSVSVPLHAYDARAAWDGADPSQPGADIHVEAAAFRGRLVYFETIYPWDQPTRQELPPESGGSRALTLIIIAVFLTALFGSALLARRNLRLGRGDRRGASRIAGLYFVVHMLVWLFSEHHNGQPAAEFVLFLVHISVACFGGINLWLLYVALEPFLRRRWPERIISWSRLLAGAFRDPLVGRDVLVGAASGAGMMLTMMLTYVGLRWAGRPPELSPNPGSFRLGGHQFIGRLASQLNMSLFVAFVMLFMLLLFVVALRRVRPALFALWLLVAVMAALVTQADPLMLPFTALFSAGMVFVLYRFGLLAAVSAYFVTHLWVFYPMTTELTAWYAADFLVGLGVCAALALYACYTSLAGQPLFGKGLLEE